VIKERASEYPRYSDEWFLDLYFQYGSVDEMIKAHNNSLPISQAQLHRVIKKRGIIKAAGRHASMAEVINFFAEKAIDPHIPLEKLYYEKMPHTFRTSVQTLHRIYKSIETKAVRRSGVALVITPEGNPEMVLCGKELKNSQTTLLMGYAKKKEDREDSVLRVLQQEFSKELAINGKMGRNGEFVKQVVVDKEPFMFLDITDVRVMVFRLMLPDKLCNLSICSSHKVANHAFVPLEALEGDRNLREGVVEILRGYGEYLGSKNHLYEPRISSSRINEKLLAFVEARG